MIDITHAVFEHIENKWANNKYVEEISKYPAVEYYAGKIDITLLNTDYYKKPEENLNKCSMICITVSKSVIIETYSWNATGALETAIDMTDPSCFDQLDSIINDHIEQFITPRRTY